MRCAIVPKPVPGSTSEAPRPSGHPTEARGDAPSSQNLSRDRLPRRRASPSSLRRPWARHHRPKTCSGIDFRGAAPLRAAYGGPGRGVGLPKSVPGSTCEASRSSEQRTEARARRNRPNTCPGIDLRGAAPLGALLRMPRARRAPPQTSPEIDLRGGAPENLDTEALAGRSGCRNLRRSTQVLVRGFVGSGETGAPPRAKRLGTRASGPHLLRHCRNWWVRAAQRGMLHG